MNSRRVSMIPALALALLASVAPHAVYAANAASIDGYWDQIDDKTGRINSLIRIETAGGETHAVIVKGYPVPGRPVDQEARCTACPGSFGGQPLIGMRFMWGLKPAGPGWEGGQILDPDEGKIYKVSATLARDGNQLTVRGYVGIPLFGRNQVWRRHDGPVER